MATAMGIAAMIVGALVNWWLPGPSHSVFPASFGLLLVMIAMVRHAYLRGVSDAAEHGRRSH
jgi:membrane protein implicated in regulation of membrane protease activity